MKKTSYALLDEFANQGGTTIDNRFSIWPGE